MNRKVPLFTDPTFKNLISLESKLKADDIWISKRWIARQEFFLEESLLGKKPRPHSLKEFVRLANNGIDLVDYGGGSGWLFHALQHDEFKINTYVNVESINLHKNCGGNDANYIHISPDQMESFRWSKNNLILYLNSVIQYFEADNHLIDLVKSLKPSLLIIDDVTPSRSREYFAYQKYYENRIAYRFVDKEQLISMLGESNYILKREIPFQRVINPSFAYEFEKQDNDFQIGSTTSFLFERL